MSDLLQIDHMYERAFATACDKEKEPPDGETVHPLRQWRIESGLESMVNLDGLSPIFD